MKASSPYFRDEEKTEHCGVVGVYCKNPKANAARLVYRAMIALQHRGQDAAGFVVWNNGFAEKKGIGFVSDIFGNGDLDVKGRVGIGHTRYPTTGLCLISDVQPFKGIDIAVSHNGQVSNYKDVRRGLEKKGFKFVSTVDSEVIVYSIHEKMREGKGIEEAVKSLMGALDGAYSITGLVGDTLVAFKDPNGIRPLVWGENDDCIMFASETVALDVNGVPHKGDLRGGELAVVRNGKLEMRRLVESKPGACMFEYVYFSRPDSVINGRSVMDARKCLGRELAREHPAKADIVIEVPDSARTAAASYAEALGIRHEEGLIKNRYVGRTFIMPTQEKRVDAVKIKLNAVREAVGGKRIVMVDDSIVRGTTIKEIVSLVRKAGAKEVHVRITCPPIRAPCFYGIDMSTYKELAAHTKSVAEIGRTIGADSIGYLSIDGLKRAIGIPLCTGCLDEGYPTPYAKKLADEQK